MAADSRLGIVKKFSISRVRVMYLLQDIRKILLRFHSLSAGLVLLKGCAVFSEGTQQADPFRRNAEEQQSISSFYHYQVMPGSDRLPGEQPDTIGRGTFGREAAGLFEVIGCGEQNRKHHPQAAEYSVEKSSEIHRAFHVCCPPEGL